MNLVSQIDGHHPGPGEQPDSRRVDVAVVGAGLAGLAAARLAQRAGLRVVVLDSHAGGRARTESVDGYLFNRGAHALYNGGAAERVLRTLGISLAGGVPPADRSFGMSGDTIGVLPSGVRSLLSTPLLTKRGKLAVGRLLGGLNKINPATLASTSVRDWFASRRLPADATALLEMIVRLTSYANAPELFSAGAAVQQVQTALSKGVRYLDGGWQQIIDALGEGVAIVAQSATSITTDGGEHSVVLNDGSAVHAKAVIVAAGTPEACGALCGRTFDAGPRVEAACLDLGLDAVPTMPILLRLDEPLYASVHCPPAALAPPGHAVVHAIKYLPVGVDHHNQETTRGQLATHVAHMGVTDSSIRTSRYLHRMTVFSGLPLATRGGIQGRVPADGSGIDGVFLAGDWVGTEGLLADASFASAESAVRLAARVAAR